MSSLPLRYKISPLLILILIFLSLFFHRFVFDFLNHYTTAFTIKNVDISGVLISQDARFNTIISSLKNFSLTQIDIYALKKELEESEFIKNADITRNFPNTLKIQITERHPLAIIKTANKNYIVDQDGVILPLSVNDKLPRIVTEFGVAINNKQIADEFLTTTLNALADKKAYLLDSMKINKDRETSFKLKNLSSEFFIDKRIITENLIEQAQLVAESIEKNNIKPPRSIDLVSEDTAIGFR